MVRRFVVAQTLLLTRGLRDSDVLASVGFCGMVGMVCGPLIGALVGSVMFSTGQGIGGTLGFNTAGDQFIAIK